MSARLVPFLLCILCNVLYASEKVSIKPAPSWLLKMHVDLNRKPNQRNISDGYYMELSDNQVNISQQTSYFHFIRHIVNESGVQNGSEVSVTFAPAYENVSFHEITIWREGKVVSTLSKEQIKIAEEESDASSYQYNGTKRTYVLLKDVRKDDRIEVAYSVKGFNPVFSGKYESEFYFVKTTEICNYFRTVIAPKGRTFYFKYFDHAPAPVESDQGNDHIYQWDNPELKLYESENNTPGWYYGYPYASMTEYSNWKDVADWGLQTFKNYDYNISGALKEKIAQWNKETAGDQDAFIEKALQFVQNQVRYLGLEMGENTHKPHSPDEVFKNRFGDCKDKSLLLTAILKQQNISAYVVLVNTNMRSKLTESAPGATQFNHAIVAIERSDDLYIYVDPTFTHQMGSIANIYVPAFEWGLMLRKGTNDLSRVVQGGITSTAVKETFYITAKGKGESRMEVQSEYKGGAADDMRSTFSENSFRDLEDSYVKYYAKSYEGIKQTNEFKIVDDSLANKLTINKYYTIPQMWTTENGVDKFNVTSFPIYNSLPNPTTLTTDVPQVLEFPLNIQHTLSLNMPSEWSFDYDPVRISTDSYEFVFLPSVVGNKIELVYSLKTLKDHVPVKDLAAYKEDYKKMVDLLEFKFTSNGNVPSKKQTHGVSGDAFNTWSALYAAVALALFFLLFIYLNKQSVHTEAFQHWHEEPRLTGWVIVLGITLGLSLLLNVVSFVKINYFSNGSWEAITASGGKTMQFIYVFELVCFLFRICGLIALLYWYFQKRDIFPRMFIGFNVNVIMLSFLLTTTYSTVKSNPTFGDLTKNGVTSTARAFFYAAIWITYVLRSEQVKRTFIYPFSKKGKANQGNGNRVAEALEEEFKNE
ncbi:DUF3857 domain-containing protein [Danxiaibacter flavus]|uniref:DUF3857 domain-containing protein n=1 Tax=Danxiaibacter flavus TaxID=3049108 RepID=A0ABV3Z9W7_9BACT|nr:DUF3857 domain-containing protein [Chitinophagaceae bacterium DXS]